jgi:hypothetical protein
MKKIVVLLCVMFGAVLISTVCPAANLPVPDIKAAGVDGPVEVGSNTSVDITVALDPGDYAGFTAEWWIAAKTDFGWYFYDSTYNWVATTVPVGNIPLFSLPATSVLNMALPVGKYTFYFALDSTLNGNPDNLVMVDKVQVDSVATPRVTVTVSSNPSRILADGTTYSAIVAVVKTPDGNPVADGTVVSFAATAGTLSAGQATTVNGYAAVNLTSSKTAGTAKVTAQAESVPGRTQVEFVPTVKQITLTADPNTVVTESEASTITATLTDGFGNPSPRGTTVRFQSTFGSIETPQMTIENGAGTASTHLSSTTAGIATVTATANGVTSPGIAVTFVGIFEIVLPVEDPLNAHNRTTGSLALTPDNASIRFFSGNPAAIYRYDLGSFSTDGFQPGDTIMIGGSEKNDGVYTVSSVSNQVLTLTAGNSLIDEPVGKSVTITNGVLVRVHAMSQSKVAFLSSVGVWDGGTSSYLERNVTAGYAWAVLTSGVSGYANVMVWDPENPDTKDTTNVAFSAPSSEATWLTLQSNAYVLAPSTGETEHSVTLTATVRNCGDQAVSGAPVVFSIENPTGGGERVSPSLVFTDSSGRATATFTSGFLGTGAGGVSVRARVLGAGETVNNTSITFVRGDGKTILDKIYRGSGSFKDDGFKDCDKILVRGSTLNDGLYKIATCDPLEVILVSNNALNNESPASVTIMAATDAVNIVIGGTAGSVAISRGTEITELNPATYSLPMAVFVADGNGNPVPGAEVSLSAWPTQYSSGVWFFDQDKDYYRPYITRTSPNEDANENLILDPGEDTNGDGLVTPHNSTSGGVPTTVTVGTDGVGTFNLVYPKSSAIWIVDRIRASVFVQGTETTSSLTLRLPGEKAEAEAGLLPDAQEPIGLVTTTTTPVSYTFPAFGDAGLYKFDAGGCLYPDYSGFSVMSTPDEYKYYSKPTDFDPLSTCPSASVGDEVWDWITATGISGIKSINAYFPVRIIIK